MRAQSEVVQEPPMEKHRRIDESAAVKIKDEFVRGMVASEDLHLKPR